MSPFILFESNFWLSTHPLDWATFCRILFQILIHNKMLLNFPKDLHLHLS